jgi:predicted AlkP superfamily pyrophosphatase or phosphodiesterase
MKRHTLLLALVVCASIHTPAHGELQKPKLTVLFIVDQLSYRLMPRIKPYVKHGLKTFLYDGLRYANAYFPHGMPATATGHAALSTGAFARDHGYIGNRWVDREGNHFYCDTDSAENAAVFNPDGGLYDYGRSAKQLMVDGISDQFMLYKDTEEPHVAYSLSIKGRAAIATASKLGKAVWLDQETGKFTSSKAYFNELPQWLQVFNQTNNINNHPFYTWHLALPYNQAAYRFADPNTYQYTHSMSPLIQRRFPVAMKNPGGYKGDVPYAVFLQTPHGDKLLLDLARACVEANMNEQDNTHMLLWVCLSSFDKLGHDYGPDSKEAYDMLYHLDKHLGEFMTDMQAKFGEQRVLFGLSADHGVVSIVELVNSMGYNSARRFYTPDIVKKMNVLIKKKYGVKKVVSSFKSPQFYLDHTKLDQLDDDIQKAITNDLVAFLRKQPEIKHVWTFDELQNSCFESDQPENFLKEQLYRGRSGEITIQTHPFALVTKWRKGTDHRSPYEFNLHVPLMFYYPGTIQARTVEQKVWITQVANTLAFLLQVSKPSASIAPVLPCMPEQCCTC